MLDPNVLIAAYAQGYFPMADARDADDVYWVDPDFRGIIPLDRFHIPRKLRKQVRRNDVTISVDDDFPAVIRACAAPRRYSEETWINQDIEDSYCQLHHRGFAHSVECRIDGALVGGLYGVALAGGFFGESMFSRAPNVSKIALVHLVARLCHGGFRLLDTQFLTDHLTQFGAIEIPRDDYHQRLQDALQATNAYFPRFLTAAALEDFLQASNQTS